MNIKEARETLGLKQSELADMLNIDTPLLSKLENGKVLPNASMRETIEKALASHSDARKGIGSINYSTVQKKSLKTEICDSVLEALQYTSYSQPISRESLKVFTKCGDRQNRDAITELRKQGYRIGSYSGGRGYWLCKSEEEYQMVRNMYLSKAKDMLATVEAMDRSIPGQMEIEYAERENNIHQDRP